MIVVCKNANTVSSKNKNTSQFKKKKKKTSPHIICIYETNLSSKFAFIKIKIKN